MSFTGLLIVMVVAFLAPLVVNLVRRFHIPGSVGEIVAGI
ncbi:MAG: cation:proton antiporter, partial [Candidatus Dormibacteraeota bacterium]|nr:cation:proton antiporter [Candidatus Dormibacteraeota bacterium]